MRIIFFGTSSFAVPALEALLHSHHDIVAVVSQPDKPAGRGRKLTASPVSQVAQAHGTTLLQPTTLKDETVLEGIRSLLPELIVVAAYGKFLPDALLAIPPQRCINIHPSLLPQYRGAAPMQWAVINGDRTTGISIQYVVKEMDAGDILKQIEVPIKPMETTSELQERLAPLAATLLLETVTELETGHNEARPQDPSAVTIAPLLTKEDGLLDWHQPAAQIINRIRGLQPWPVAFTHLHGEPFKIYRAELPDDRSIPDGAKPGQIIAVTRSLHVATGDGRLCLTDVQLAGKKRMKSEDFLRGYHVEPGEILQ